MKSLYFVLKRLILVFALIMASGVQAQPLEPPPGFIVHYERSAIEAAPGTALPSSGGRWLDRQTQVIDFTPVAATAAMPPTAESAAADRAARWQAFHARMAELAALPGVRLVEPDYLGTFDAVLPAPWPNDPRSIEQWWLTQIQAPYLWGLAAQRETLVAVIDTGVDAGHPDLAGVFDPRGYSFGDDSEDIYDYHPMSHGTGVTGVIAAKRNNNIGVAGLGVGVKILPIKVNKGGEADFRTSVLAQSIRYAVDSGAQVISLSLSVDEQTELIVDEINHAFSHGIIVVASVGNTGGAVRFPASMPGVIAVAASDQTGALAGFSNFGPEVTVAAPGSSVLTTAVGGNYHIVSGTSFAVPIVSAAVASALAIHSGYPVDQITTLLTMSTVPLRGAGNLSFGNLDIEKFSFWLLPQLFSYKSQYRSHESLELIASIPPTVRPISIAVTVDSPWGGLYLLGDNSWWALDGSGVAPPALAGYDFPVLFVAGLYGDDSLLGPFPLAGLPSGDYLWRVTMIDDQTQRPVGATTVTLTTLLP